MVEEIYDIDKAPSYYNHDQASGWCAGWNACLAALRAERTNAEPIDLHKLADDIQHGRVDLAVLHDRLSK